MQEQNLRTKRKEKKKRKGVPPYVVGKHFVEVCTCVCMIQLGVKPPAVVSARRVKSVKTSMSVSICQTNVFSTMCSFHSGVTCLRRRIHAHTRHTAPL